jgi:hypothetical protein
VSNENEAHGGVAHVMARHAFCVRRRIAIRRGRISGFSSGYEVRFGSMRCDEQIDQEGLEAAETGQYCE